MAYIIHSVLPVPPRKIVYIHPDETIKTSIDLMREHNIGALVVVDAKDELVGIVSERDIVRSCVDECPNLNTSTVGEIVNTDVTILSPHDLVEQAMQAMTETKRRHILIREHDEFVAILSIGDLLYHLLEDKARVIEQLEKYIST